MHHKQALVADWGHKCVNTCSEEWNVVSHCSVHFYWWLFSNNWFKGCTTVDRLGKNLYCCSNWLAPGTTLPQLYCMGGALWKTASTFSGVLWRPWLSISCPQKVIFSLKNSHSVLFALNPWVCKRRKTSFRLARCSSSFSPVMIKTSRIQLVLDVPSNTWSMGRCQGV